MTNPTTPERYAPITTDEQITEVVIASLLVVNDSQGNLSTEELAKEVSTKTHCAEPDVNRVINDVMFEDDLAFPLLKISKELGGTAFAVSGLWLIESAFMHGEENVDGMQVAHNILSRGRYFGLFNRPDDVL